MDVDHAESNSRSTVSHTLFVGYRIGRLGRHGVTPSKTSGVTIVLSQLGPGGAERNVTNLANAWVQRDLRVTLIVLKPFAKPAFDLDPRIEIVILMDRAPRRSFFHLAGLWRLARMLPKLRRAIKKTAAPVVLSFIRATNVRLILACLGLRGVWVVISERNDPSRQKSGGLWDALARLSYRHADVVTANSHGALENLATFVPREKLVYVPNLLLPPTMTHRADLPAPTVLAVGRLVPQKGYYTLLSAFAKAHRQIPEWRLVVLGDGPLRDEMTDLAKSLGITAHVDWLGHVDDPFPYYRSAKIFAMASLYEGTPNALMEAMSCGLAPIVTDSSPGPLELVEHDKTGLVASCGDQLALSHALVRMASDAELRQQLGAAAKKRVIEFDVDHAAPVWDGLLGIGSVSPIN